MLKENICGGRKYPSVGAEITRTTLGLVAEMAATVGADETIVWYRLGCAVELIVVAVDAEGLFPLGVNVKVENPDC